MEIKDIHNHTSSFVEKALILDRRICKLLEEKEIDNEKNEILLNALTVSVQGLCAIQSFLKLSLETDLISFYISPIKLIIRNISIYQIDLHYLILKEIDNYDEFLKEIFKLKNEGLDRKRLFKDEEIEKLRESVKGNSKAEKFVEVLNKNQVFIKHKKIDTKTVSLKNKFIEIITSKKFDSGVLMHIWFNYSHYSKITHGGFFTNKESQFYYEKQFFNDVCMIFYSIKFLLENFNLDIDISDLNKSYNTAVEFSEVYS